MLFAILPGTYGLILRPFNIQHSFLDPLDLSPPNVAVEGAHPGPPPEPGKEERLLGDSNGCPEMKPHERGGGLLMLDLSPKRGI